MPICNTCHQPFEDYKELAKHIIINKKTHKKGRLWASKFLSKQQLLDKKRANTERIPLTEQDKENKLNTRRDVSGETTTTLAICPKCNREHFYTFPIEYVQSPTAWKRNNSIVKLCSVCES